MSFISKQLWPLWTNQKLKVIQFSKSVKVEWCLLHPRLGQASSRMFLWHLLNQVGQQIQKNKTNFLPLPFWPTWNFTVGLGYQGLWAQSFSELWPTALPCTKAQKDQGLESGILHVWKWCFSYILVIATLEYSALFLYLKDKIDASKDHNNTWCY